MMNPEIDRARWMQLVQSQIKEKIRMRHLSPPPDNVKPSKSPALMMTPIKPKSRRVAPKSANKNTVQNGRRLILQGTTKEIQIIRKPKSAVKYQKQKRD